MTLAELAREPVYEESVSALEKKIESLEKQVNEQHDLIEENASLRRAFFLQTQTMEIWKKRAETAEQKLKDNEN